MVYKYKVKSLRVSQTTTLTSIRNEKNKQADKKIHQSKMFSLKIQILIIATVFLGKLIMLSTKFFILSKGCCQTRTQSLCSLYYDSDGAHKGCNMTISKIKKCCKLLWVRDCLAFIIIAYSNGTKLAGAVQKELN